MDITLLSGSANPDLARAIAGQLGMSLAPCVLERFPDGEIHVELLETVRGRDVFLIQPTSPAAEAHLLELVLLADAARRAGAARVTAVVPYFGYARQDRRTRTREPIGARVLADLIRAGGVEHVVVVDLHTASVEGFFSIPVEHLSAVPLLAEAARRLVSGSATIVAPDLGAVKLAERYAELLYLPVATVHKVRMSGREVQVREIVGDVRGRRPVIVDDMLSTGGTVVAAATALLEAGCLPEITVVVSHGLFVGSAAGALQNVPVRQLITTDSVARPPGFSLPLEVTGLAPLLAEAVRRLNRRETLQHLIRPG